MKPSTLAAPFAGPLASPVAGLIDLAARGLDALAARAQTSFELTFPNGRHLQCGTGPSRFHVRLHTARSVLALVTRNEMSLGEAFLAGDVDIDGDIPSMLRLRDFLADVSPIDHLRHTYLRPLLRGRVRNDERLIEEHYDESPGFYLTFLDRRHRCYSHGYFATPDESLEDAITRKLATALETLGLPKGSRILDIGAGWGAMTEFGAKAGYRMTSLTLSNPSFAYVSDLIRTQHLTAEVKRCHLLAYEDEPFDGIVNLGVTEHLPDYDRTVAAYDRLLKPGGRVFLDACSSRVKYPFSRFVKKHIWAGDTTPWVLHDYARAVAKSRLEIVSFTDDRESYRLTTKVWAQNLEAAKDDIVARFGLKQFRRFQLYLWGCVHGFARHDFGAGHWVLHKPADASPYGRRRGWARLPV